MALEAGSKTADAGMSRAIYDQLDALLAGPLQDAVHDAEVAGDAKLQAAAQEALDSAREGWKKLSFAIAAGVVNHIRTNLEITGIQARGDINASVSGQAATQSGVTFIQSNNGTGLVQ